MTDTTAWVAYLDSLEAEVRAVGRTLDGRNPVTFVPPDHLGPLPAELADRVRDVLGTIATVSDTVRDGLERTRTQLHDLHRHDPRGPKPASVFDTHA